MTSGGESLGERCDARRRRAVRQIQVRLGQELDTGTARALARKVSIDSTSYETSKQRFALRAHWGRGHPAATTNALFVDGGEFVMMSTFRNDKLEHPFGITAWRALSRGVQ